MDSTHLHTASAFLHLPFSFPNTGGVAVSGSAYRPSSVEINSSGQMAWASNQTAKGFTVESAGAGEPGQAEETAALLFCLNPSHIVIFSQNSVHPEMDFMDGSLWPLAVSC